MPARPPLPSARRRWLLASLGGLSGLGGLSTALAQTTPLGTIANSEALGTPPASAAALRGEALPLVFPRDRGSHPGFGTEWWYITGQAATAAGRSFGFQLTFFRSRVDGTQAMRSRFAARQLLFAHAAITDVQGKRLWHDQRLAREGFGVAQASTSDMHVQLRDWSLQAQDNQYQASLPADGFGLQLQLQETQPVLLQGQQGWSRKGPQTRQASYYYSQPQLRATGRLRVGTDDFAVSGKAWLDHEWSQELLHQDAVGWDWTGMNFDDGSALTAFRLRDAQGAPVWAGGSFRDAAGALRVLAPTELRWVALRYWTSPFTQTRYPVAWELHTPMGRYTLQPVLDNQELDSRASTGAVYWEGLSHLYDSQGRRVASGYVELTGYGAALKL